MIASAAAQYGLFAAQRRFADSAERVARINQDGAEIDLPRELIAQALAVTEVAANAQVLQAAQRMSRKGLDILA